MKKKLRLCDVNYIRKKAYLYVNASKPPILCKYCIEKEQEKHNIWISYTVKYSSSTKKNSKKILPIYCTLLKEIIKKINF